MSSSISMKNIPNWEYYKSKHQLKEEFGTDQLYEVNYGYMEDEAESYELMMYMREPILKGILNQSYHPRIHNGVLEVYDLDYKYIEPILKDYIY